MRSRIRLRLPLAALSVCLALSAAPTRADEPNIPRGLDAVIADLAARDAVTRRREVERLGLVYEEGAPLAHILTTIALEDDDAMVKTAARAAVERLAIPACETWRQFLVSVKDEPASHVAFRETATEILHLGAKITLTDIAAGLDGWTADFVRSDVLGVVALALREGHRLNRGDLAGLDLLLADEGGRGGARTKRMATAAQVLAATARLRSVTDGAPHPAPEVTADGASWNALLASSDRWVKESSAAVLAAVGRPGTDILTTLANGKWLPALATLGRGAERVAPLVRARPTPGREVQRVATLLQLGDRQGLLPKPPEAGRGPSAWEEYAWVVAEVARAEPELARAAEVSLVALIDGRSGGREAQEGSLVALGRMGRLAADTRDALSRFAAQPYPEAVPGEFLRLDAPLARLALLRGMDASPELVAAVVNDFASLQQDRHFRWQGSPYWVEVLRVLPLLRSDLNPARREIEMALDTRGGEKAFRVALVRLLGRLPSADSGTVALLRALSAEGGWLSDVPHDLAAGPVAKQVLRLGAALTEPIEGRRAVADAFCDLGALAAPAAPDLEALRADPDVALRWRALRALTAIQTAPR